MSDLDFESRLERMFAQPPRVADPEGFTQRVQRKLDREWSLRRLLIGAAGLVGGVLAMTETAGSEAFAQLREAMAPFAGQAERALTMQWYPDDGVAQALASGQSMWVLTALAALAATLTVARLSEAI